MGFHVDYSGLDQLYSDLYSNVSAWNQSLVTLAGTVNALVSSSSMAGSGADSIRAYFDSMHNTLIPVISQLIKAHANNCLLYIRSYQSGIDTGLHAVIDESVLEQINRQLRVQYGFAEETNAAVQKTIGSVSDIVSVSCPGFPAITDSHREIQRLLEKLWTDIRNLEDHHYQTDFVDTSSLIASLNAFIAQHLKDSRWYKSNFSVESFVQDQSFIALTQAYVAVNAQVEANQDTVLQALKEENSRFEALNAEVEARQKEATTEKWVVTGLCVVGSIAAIGVIVASGGTATPLVVGAVSAVSGAVIAGNNAAADEYVAHGWNTSEWDAGNIGSSAVLGGVSGFITGYVGAGVSGVLTNELSAAGSTLLNSSSMAVRVGSNAVIGSTTQVVSGVATRGVSTFTTTIIETGGDVTTSVDAAWKAATDGQQMLLDAAIGGVSGGVKGIQKPTTVQPQTDVDDTIPKKEFAPDVEVEQDRLSDSRYFSKGDHYAEYREFWENGSDYELIPNEGSDVTYVRARDIEGVYLYDSEVQNPEGFWTRYGREGYTQDSIINKASYISEVREKLNSGMTLEEIAADPRLKDTVNSYFNRPIEVEKVGDFYTFVVEGRHRTIAAQSIDTELPVLIKGEYIHR